MDVWNDDDKRQKCAVGVNDRQESEMAFDIFLSWSETSLGF